MRPQHVAVVGGGFTGTLQAIQLLRRGVGRVTLIERAHIPARGVAYSTSHPQHLLNVRASAMSAFPEKAGHFADWLAGHGGAPADFAQRQVYGAYVEQLLTEAAASAGERLRVLADEVVVIDSAGGCERLLLKSGSSLDADSVILAVGNLPPALPPAVAGAGLPPGIYIEDPWSEDFAGGLSHDDSVLLIGTGLTAVDAALMLEASGFVGPTLALSRRGLLPRAHSEPAPVPPLEDMRAPECLSLLRSVRSAAEKIGWRSAVDQLRPVTQSLWAAADVAERRRFLRHLRPWWDVHRHRIAPAIADSIRAMQETGSLHAAGGKIHRVRADGDGAIVSWRARGAEQEQEIAVSRIVNCTGPEADIRRAGDPLLDSLLGSGRIRPDLCRIGIDVDQTCRILDAQGHVSQSLYAVGPMTRGAFWEIVAVPDIRVQVEALAGRLAAG